MINNILTSHKNIILNTIGTTLNAFNSLFFMIIVTRINGTISAGVFTYAFSITLLFNIIGTYYGRIFQVTAPKKFTDEDFFWNKTLTCLITLLLSIIFIALNQYPLKKSLIILTLTIYRTLEAFSECLYAYYQKNNDLYKVGISLSLKNILGLTAFILTDYITKNLLQSTITLTITNLVIVFIYDLKAIKQYKISLTNKNPKKIFLLLKKGFSPFILSFLIQLLINIPRYIIDIEIPDESAIWGILIMPASIMTLLGQFCISPFIVELHQLYKTKNTKTYLKKVKNICLFILTCGLIAILSAYILGIPILSLVYAIDLSNYKLSFMIIMSGAVLYGIQNILYNLLIAMRKINIQVYIYIINITISTILYYILIPKNHLLGASISYTTTMTLLFITYLIIFIIYSLKNKKIKE